MGLPGLDDWWTHHRWDGRLRLLRSFAGPLVAMAEASGSAMESVDTTAVKRLAAAQGNCPDRRFDLVAGMAAGLASRQSSRAQRVDSICSRTANAPKLSNQTSPNL